MGAGGAGLSLTGGGALLGVPTCAAGIALAANGAVTFINGGRKIIVALCHWEELPTAASAESASTAGTPSTSTNAGPPAGTAAGGSGVKPAAPAAAAKPPPAAAKPAATPVATSPTPAQSGPTLHLGKHLGSGKKSSPNTTTWVRCTGQKHHAISKTIHKKLQGHATLKNVYKERDNRFVTQAIDKAAHNGYDSWHRSYERQVEAWLKKYDQATPAQFEAYLLDLYKTDQELARRFPNGL